MNTKLLNIFPVLAGLLAPGLIILILFSACSPSVPPFKGTVIQPLTDAPAINLQDQNGKNFRIVDNKGKILLLFFGFTHCPDACPSTLMNWSSIKRDLGKDAEKVEFIFVTVDPTRDTKKSLQDYISLYGEDITGLTGSQNELNSVYKSYGIFAEKDSAKIGEGSYLINHTTSIILIDKQGKWRLNYGFATRPEDISSDIKLLLNE